MLSSLLQNIYVQVGSAVGVFYVVYDVFKKFENELASKEAKNKLSEFIKNVKFPQASDMTALDVYNYVFSPYHLSVRCVAAVACVASLSLGLILLSLHRVWHLLLFEGVLSLLITNILAEYLALYFTRVILQRIQVGSAASRLTFFLSDTALKFLVSLVVFPALLTAWYVLVRGIRFDLSETIAMMIRIFATDPVWWVPFTTLVLGSLWIWVCVFSLTHLNRIAKIMETIRWTLNFDEHPVRSVGFVTAVLSAIAYFVVLVIVGSTGR